MIRAEGEPVDALVGHGDGWRGHLSISPPLVTLVKR